MDETTKTPASTPRKTPRWVKLLLGASLALNLLVIGVASGAAWRVSKMGGAPQTRNGFAFVSALERDDRKAVLAELRKAGKAAHEQGRDDMEAVLTLLRAETLDQAALRATIERQIARGADFQVRISSEWLGRVEKMDQAARMTYADRLEENLKNRGKRRKHRRD